MEILPERRYAPWRKRLWALVEGIHVLEVVVVRLMGPHINRRTVENMQKAGLMLERVEDLGMGDIFKFIQARKEMTTNAT